MNEELLRRADGSRPETCEGAAAMFSVRPSARPCRRSPRRGVSLVELLVVLAIMLLDLRDGRSPHRSAAPEGPARGRRQRAGGPGPEGCPRSADPAGRAGAVHLPESHARHPGLRAHRGHGGRRREATACSRTRAAGPLPIRSSRPFSRFGCPRGSSSIDLPAPYDNCWSNWAASGTDFVLGLDFQGRTVGPGAIGVDASGTAIGIPGRQIAGPASVNLTHADMVSGAVTPLVVHRVTIGTVWGVRHTRLVQDGTIWREF